AVAYQGQRPVIHLPPGDYFLSSTLSIPANLDVQIIGDGYTTMLGLSGSSGGAILQLHSPSKALIQDLGLYGYGTAEGILIGSEDLAGSRVQAQMLYLTGNTGVVNEGLTRARTNVTGASFDQMSQAFRVIGTGAPATSQ